MDDLDALAAEIRACTFCTDLPLGPRPILRVSRTATILIASQAPGTKVHASGTPWTDASGVRLRQWLGLTEAEFYDPSRVAILPMGLCYPGRYPQGGDLPPRPACAPRWRARVLAAMPQLRLTLLVGGHAQAGALGPGGMTGRVREFRSWLPRYFPLPHPSWRTGIWERNNPWFTTDVLPALRAEVRRVLAAAAAVCALGAAPATAAQLEALLPAPPPDSSPATVRDLAALHRLQAERTPAEEAAARADMEESVFIFRDVLGPAFNPRGLPVTADLFARLAEHANADLNRAKQTWSRTRPSRLDPTLRPCVPVPGTASYPSSHAMLGRLYAAVLGRMIPEHRAALFARADAYARHRETCGLHYPSDTAAGTEAGAALAAEALADPARYLAAAAQELRPALHLDPAIPTPPSQEDPPGAEDFRNQTR